MTIRLWIARHLAPIKVTIHEIPVNIPAPDIAETEVLQDRPWVNCPCEVCRKIGIQVILFRGTERNKRRGFHNLVIFYAQLQKELASSVLEPERLNK